MPHSFISESTKTSVCYKILHSTLFLNQGRGNKCYNTIQIHRSDSDEAVSKKKQKKKQFVKDSFVF